MQWEIHMAVADAATLLWDFVVAQLSGLKCPWRQSFESLDSHKPT